jgi:hypothetical protein
MNDPDHSQRSPDVDPALEAEWERLENERIAEERAEARVDAEEAAHHPPPKVSDRQRLTQAFFVSLAAGGVLAFLLNRPQPKPATDAEQVAAVRRAVDIWAEANRIDEAALRSAGVRRITSTATVPSDQLSIRVMIRDQQGRDRLESLLAASRLRIESDRDRPVQPDTVIDSLAVSGPPGDVDALLDRLIASPTMLEVYSPALLAGVSQKAAATEEVDDAVAGRLSAASVTQTPPPRVRLRVEVTEAPSNPAPENSSADATKGRT